MILLDENIRQDQAEKLLKWHISCRFLMKDLADSGTQDPDIISILHHLKRPTFFTHDQDYFRRRLVHPNYALVWLDLFDGDAAHFVRRFLSHRDFKTHSKRLGRVARVHETGVDFWALSSSLLHTLRW